MMYLTSITIASFIFTLSMIMFYRRFCVSKRQYVKVDKNVIEDVHTKLGELKANIDARRDHKLCKKKIDDSSNIDVEEHEDIEKYLDESTLKMVNTCKSMMPAGKFDQVKSVVISYVSGKGDARSLGEALHNELNIGFFLKSYIDNNSSISQIEDLRKENRRNMAVSKIQERQKVREMNNVDILKPNRAVNSDEINDIKLELARLKRSISKGKGKLDDDIEESEDEDIVEGGDDIEESEDEDIVEEDDVDRREEEELDYIEGEHNSDDDEDEHNSDDDEELELDIYIPEYFLEDDDEDVTDEYDDDEDDDEVVEED